MKEEITGWQWHELDHTRIICISLQTDNHANTSPLSFYRSDVLPATRLSKHWRQKMLDLLQDICKLHQMEWLMIFCKWHNETGHLARETTINNGVYCNKLWRMKKDENQSHSNQPCLTTVFCSANVESSSKLSEDKFSNDYNIIRSENILLHPDGQHCKPNVCKPLEDMTYQCHPKRHIVAWKTHHMIHISSNQSTGGGVVQSQKLLLLLLHLFNGLFSRTKNMVRLKVEKAFCLLILYSFHASVDFSFFPISILFLLFHYCFSNFLIPPRFLMTEWAFWQSTCDPCCFDHYIFHLLPVFIYIKVFPLCFSTFWKKLLIEFREKW